MASETSIPQREHAGHRADDRSLEVLAAMGSLVIIGFSSIDADYADVIPRLHPLTLFHRSISVGGLNIDNLAFQRRSDIWDRLVDHAEQHRIRPSVRHVFPFEDIRAAHDLLGSRRSIGKVVLAMDPSAHAPASAATDRRPAAASVA